MIRVELTDFNSQENAILSIRFDVFVKEQHVDPDLEIDGRDSQCLHALAFKDKEPVGTGRLLPDGHIGRMAVLKPFRSQGIGTQIFRALLTAVKDRKIERIILSSQVSAIPFYERFGFNPKGPVYREAGIDHQEMELNIP